LFEFLDIDANVSDVEITDEMFNKVIEEIKSNDRETRDRGITKILLIDSVVDFNGFRSNTNF
jgi:hypothetical protein